MPDVFQLEAQGSGLVSIDIGASGGLVRSVSVSDLTGQLVSVQAGPPGDLVLFEAVAGQTYRVAVAG